MPQKPKFTRVMKVQDLAYAGVPTKAIPTYCALSDYANNKSGLCWPKMETLAKTLGRSVIPENGVLPMKVCGADWLSTAYLP